MRIYGADDKNRETKGNGQAFQHPYGNPGSLQQVEKKESPAI